LHEANSKPGPLKTKGSGTRGGSPSNCSVLSYAERALTSIFHGSVVGVAVKGCHPPHAPPNSYPGPPVL
jgi:hypothetical protein